MGGLILFTSGLAISSFTLLDIDSLAATFLGLYFGAAFILLTIGLYMMMVVFIKQKAKQSIQIVESDYQKRETIQESLATTETSRVQTLDHPSTMIEDTIALNLFEDSDLDQIKPDLTAEENGTETLLFQNLSTIENEALETRAIILPSNLESTQDDLEIIDSEESDEVSIDEFEILQEDFDERLNDETEDKKTSHEPRTIEARLIGIEGFRSQSILKKLKENTEVTLKFNEKNGLKSSEIFYQSKSIGFLSKVDYNLMQQHLDGLEKIMISTKVYDGNKIATVLLSFVFRT